MTPSDQTFAFLIAPGWAPSSSSLPTSVSVLCLLPSSSSLRGNSLCKFSIRTPYTCVCDSRLNCCFMCFSRDRHEYISGYYRVSVYFLSKILSDIALRTVTSVIFSCVVYFLIGETFIYLSILIFAFKFK